MNSCYTRAFATPFIWNRVKRANWKNKVKWIESGAHRGSSSLVLPRPYNGITFSLLMAALHTGHSWRVGRVSSHWCKQGQQNRCPHILTTASLAVSKQILHSNIESSFLVLFASFACLFALDVSGVDALADDGEDCSLSVGCMFSLFMLLLALGALLLSVSVDCGVSVATGIGAGSDSEDIALFSSFTSSFSMALTIQFPDSSPLISTIRTERKTTHVKIAHTITSAYKSIHLCYLNMQTVRCTCLSGRVLR